MDYSRKDRLTKTVFLFALFFATRILFYGLSSDKMNLFDDTKVSLMVKFQNDDNFIRLGYESIHLFFV